MPISYADTKLHCAHEQSAGSQPFLSHTYILDGETKGVKMPTSMILSIIELDYNGQRTSLGNLRRNLESIHVSRTTMIQTAGLQHKDDSKS